MQISELLYYRHRLDQIKAPSGVGSPVQSWLPIMLLLLNTSLYLAIPLFSSNIPYVQLTRMASVIFFFAAALSFNAYYVTTIGSGVSLYSGLFHVSMASMAIEFFIFLVGGSILLPWALSPLIGFSISASFLGCSNALLSLCSYLKIKSFAVSSYMLSAAAGLKYLLVLSLAFILGSVLLYGYTNISNIDPISSLIHESFTASIIYTSQAQFWKDAAEKDTGQTTSNPNIIAARIQKRGGPITHNDVNAVLANQGIVITAEELEKLIMIPYVTHSLSIVALIKAMYPGSSSLWAIYMLINPMNVVYVGSTANFGARLQHYIKTHKGKLRLILQEIQNLGITSFTLRVYSIPQNLRESRLLLALEQYYILAIVPQNNSLMVAKGSPGGMALAAQNSLINSTPLYLSIAGQLIYVFNSMNGKGLGNNAVEGLGTSTTIIGKLLNTGVLYMAMFTLSRTPPTGFTPQQALDSDNLISFEQMVLLVTEAKVNWKANVVRTKTPGNPTGPKPTTPANTVTRLSDGSIFSFVSFNSTRTWVLKETGVNISNDTIRRRIESGDPLNGYLYKVSN